MDHLVGTVPSLHFTGVDFLLPLHTMKILPWIAFSALILLACHSRVVDADFATSIYGSVTVSGTDLGADLSYGGTYKASSATFDQMKEDAFYALSRMDHRDNNSRDGASSPTLIIYGTHAFDNTTEPNAITQIVGCEAYFNDTKCSSCGFCRANGLTPGGSSLPPTSVATHNYYFDCQGIVENRICRGVYYRNSDDLDSLDGSCTVEPGAFQGVNSCFEDPPPTPAPTPEPTYETSSAKPMVTLHIAVAIWCAWKVIYLV